MNQLIVEGLNLMLMGMGAVFVFLALLVFTTSFMSKLVAKYAPPPAARPLPAAAPDPKGDDSQLLAVITAAVHQHRSRQK